MRIPNTNVAVLVAGLLLSFVCIARGEFKDFITARDGQLLEDGQPFRFISFNIPNLTYTEDDMRFEQLTGFRLPTQYEIDDALATIQQMGGRVARTYVLSVRKPTDPPAPRHIIGSDKTSENAMVALDLALESANKHNVRLIIPFIDNASWWGGIEDFAKYRGKTKADFYTDPQLKRDYKTIVAQVITRVNTRTGVPYKEDKAVLAWELGNELVAPKDWVAEMATYIKSLDKNHLVAESYFTAPDNAGVDIVQDHLYQGDPVAMINQIRRSAKQAAGKRVYMVGEFGFIGTEGMRAIIDAIIADPTIAGGLIWSLRFHNSDGGYYWHHEPHGGDFFKAYHWPGGPAGEPYDETRFMRMVREKAFEIQGKEPPPLTPPAAPDLFSVTDGGVANWRGSTGAATYDLERAEKPDGPWKIVASSLTADAAQYRPLAVDEFPKIGQSYYYRLIARNEAGASPPSKTFGPIKIRCRTLVDELRNLSLVYRKQGKGELRDNDARNYKEDCHRLRGEPNDWVAYLVPGKMKTIRVYAFGEKDDPALDFYSGHDGVKGKKLTAKATDYYAGKEMYNFRWPRLYEVELAPDAAPGVTIVFRKDAQLARVEVEYE